MVSQRANSKSSPAAYLRPLAVQRRGACTLVRHRSPLQVDTGRKELHPQFPLVLTVPHRTLAEDAPCICVRLASAEPRERVDAPPSTVAGWRWALVSHDADVLAIHGDLTSHFNYILCRMTVSTNWNLKSVISPQQY